ncbi:MAG: hypothetical protein ACE5Z5_07630 [Candidatus Bathyarchaeia archaeon]
MSVCDLSIVNRSDYVRLEGAMESPVLPLLIFRRGMKDSAKTLTIVDTSDRWCVVPLLET